MNLSVNTPAISPQFDPEFAPPLRLSGDEEAVVARYARLRGLTHGEALRRLVLAGLDAEGVVLPPRSRAALRAVSVRVDARESGRSLRSDLRAAALDREGSALPPRIAVTARAPLGEGDAAILPAPGGPDGDLSASAPMAEFACPGEAERGAR
jgi:hypothetical protein